MSDSSKPSPRLHPSWLAHLEDEFQSLHMIALRAFLLEEKKNHTVYPPGPLMFAAFDHTPFEKVRVVLLGQDPYHGPGQAHGLSFSVRPPTPPPPSLLNIFQELHDDLGIPPSKHGDLTSWAEQGVLLLNSVLSVRAGQASSHAGQGWESFTDRVIYEINQRHEHLVFLLWGRHAKEKARQVDPRRHLILSAAHPSPFSASSGFFGCRHFSKANAYLQQHGFPPIEWGLPPLAPPSQG